MKDFYKHPKYIQDRITTLDKSTQLDKDNYEMKKNYYSSPPTKLDYAKTMNLFHDFGMNIKQITIPNFETKNQLFNWRTDYIKKYLSKKDYWQ